MKNLVIVESPTKAKTISTFFNGKNYEVVASYGHIRDLPKSQLGIDIENNFIPSYVIPRKSQKIVSALRKKAEQASNIILATDEDREGEAIAWHIASVLGLGNFNYLNNKKQKPLNKPYQRIVFHEITKPAIEKALNNPREIDMNLVNAQQARRILDRLVGYELSPFLWKKIFRGLSAGRVQSPALRLIVEREKERENFKSVEYFTLKGIFLNNNQNNKKNPIQLEADLIKINGKSISLPGITSKEEAEKIKNELVDTSAQIIDIKQTTTKKEPLPPFTTSTLQQTAFQIFRFPAKKTMFLAQSLYEGKDLGNGAIGLITYMRTDSLNISPLALNAAKEYITQKIGSQYTLEKPRIFYNRSKLAQEAHEAIRPTDPFLEPEKIKKYLSPDEYKLYSLIWMRFLATQMKEAILNRTNILIKAKKENEYLFQTNFYELIFDGFTKIYSHIKLPELTNFPQELKINDELSIKDILIQSHFTQPPPRYNDASLVKTLETFGIGRPSTYAPIINILQERGYVVRDENKAFKPTEIGILVNDLLTKHFSQIVNYQFTAQMENALDEIAQGKRNLEETIKNFYLPFKQNLKQKYEEINKDDLLSIKKLDEKCPLCGNDLVIRYGRYGQFISCSNWPNCKYKRSLNPNQEPEILDIICPKCQQGKIVVKKNKKGKIFYACSRWPECDFTSSYKPTGEFCPLCGSYLIETKNSIKCSNKNCEYEILKDSIN
ncbi:MAG: type I DNA topoisomerase [Minisyncoccia bacterium]|jgi:DNA topoisomerase-1